MPDYSTVAKHKSHSLSQQSPIHQFCLSICQSVCMYVCRCKQTAGRNSCSIVSGDVSNCSYRLTVHPVTSSGLSSALNCVYTRKTPNNYRNDRPSRMWLLSEPATPATMRSRLNRQRPVGARNNCGHALRRQIEPKQRKSTSQNGDNESFTA